jgi:hypothetical protein
MIWWEREIYVKILIEYQEEKKHKEMSQNSGFNGLNL